jgi:hypothetical protein
MSVLGADWWLNQIDDPIKMPKRTKTEETTKPKKAVNLHLFDRFGDDYVLSHEEFCSIYNIHETSSASMISKKRLPKADRSAKNENPNVNRVRKRMWSLGLVRGFDKNV